MAEKVRFESRGPCAIDSRAMGQAIDPRAATANAIAGTTAVVEICGPMVHHFSYGLDSYEAILSRVQGVCLASVTDIILKIDSPGGDVYGCFETARAVRAICGVSGKRLHAYVSGAGTSAAYALACAADRIYASDVACLGSIGVIDMMVSVVRQDAASGVDTATVTSGERKADGNPHVALSEDALAAHKQHVNDLAAVFFAWVSERRGLSVETIQGMQAGVFVGARAKDTGLVDEITDFRSLQEILASGTIDATARNVPKGMNMSNGPKASKYTDAMAALAALAEDGDEDAKKAMKKMLTAAKPESDDKPAPDSEPKKEVKAEGDDKKPEAAAAAPAASADVSAIFAAVAKLEAAEKGRAESSERATLLAARPDLMADATLKAQLETASLETVRTICKIMPKAELKAPAQAQPTRGATAGTSQGMPADDALALKERMGLSPTHVANVRKFGDADVIVFGATEAQAAKIAAERGF